MKLRNKIILIALTGVVALSLGATKANFAPAKNYEILLNFFRDVNIFYVDSVDTEKLLLDATAAMTKSLDPYTTFIPAKDMADFEFMTTGKYGGMGAVIRQKGDYVIIAEPYKDTPADKAGLQIGDKILEIDGASAKGYSTQKVSSLLKGVPGTKFDLKVEKLLSQDTVAMKITRERISISGVTYSAMLDDNVGYIALSDFTQGCADDVIKAFMALKKQGAESLVLDLRDNGGGILQEAVKIVSMFVPKGTSVVSMKGKTKSANEVFKTLDAPLDTEIPLAVLINRNSASASEIVSGAIQDLDRGVLIGQKTFGKGLVQNTRPLGYDSYLKVTTAKYYIPSGRCIQALDYSHRDKDGRVDNVPDSLIKEFKTALGRRVYDGGGVAPDVKMTEDKLSTFTMILYAKGYIDDFVAEYLRKNKAVEVSEQGFALSDKCYTEFREFLKDKDVSWESETKKTLAKLKVAAKKDDLLSSTAPLIAQMEKAISYDKQQNLTKYKAEIAEQLEEQILLHKYYRRGVIKNSLPKDKEVLKAQSILKNNQEYTRILSNTKDKIK